MFTPLSICLWLAGWFASKITQKLLIQFPKNLDAEWVLAQQNTVVFGADPDEGMDPEIRSHFL